MQKEEILLEDRIWWDYIHRDMKELLHESELLVQNVGKWKHKFHDYAFVVFPAAKAYEGFLKKIFLDMGFITEEDYYGKHFRIGKALNPSLEPRFREAESVYDKLVSFCQGEDLPKTLWTTWKHARNMVFHWFPDEKNAITFPEAKRLVYEIFDSMDLAFQGCKIDEFKEKPNPVLHNTLSSE
jgi:hypothetical protein